MAININNTINIISNTSFNTLGFVATPAAPASGSFAGFTIISKEAVITSLIDYNENELVVANDNRFMDLLPGITIPLYCKYVELSVGSILIHPISTQIPQL
jgi:hypothetical protein